MRVILLLAGFLLIGSAQAQQVYKCVNGDQVAYQSLPCPETAKKVDKAGIVAPGVASSSHEKQQRYEAERKIEADRRYLRQSASSETGRARTAPQAAVTPARSGPSCAVAKMHRDSTLRALGKDIDTATLRHVEQVVSRACK